MDSYRDYDIYLRQRLYDRYFDLIETMLHLGLITHQEWNDHTVDIYDRIIRLKNGDKENIDHE